MHGTGRTIGMRTSCRKSSRYCLLLWVVGGVAPGRCLRLLRLLRPTDTADAILESLVFLDSLGIVHTSRRLRPKQSRDDTRRLLFRMLEETGYEIACLGHRGLESFYRWVQGRNDIRRGRFHDSRRGVRVRCRVRGRWVVRVLVWVRQTLQSFVFPYHMVQLHCQYCPGDCCLVPWGGGDDGGSLYKVIGVKTLYSSRVTTPRRVRSVVSLRSGSLRLNNTTPPPRIGED